MDSDSASNSYNDNVHNNNRPNLKLCDSANFNGDSRPRKKSIAWDYYDKIGVAVDGKEKCKCKGCGKVYTCGSRVGTTVLLYHIPKCPKPYSVDRKKSGIDSAKEEQLGPRSKLDQKIVHELMTRLIIQHDLPFQLVEWDGFRELARYISSDEVQCVSSDVVAADVMKVYMAEKEKLKNQLAGISGKVCLSFNCWSSDTTRSYFALAAHYVDENWKLNIKLLDFFHFGDNELGRKLSNCLREWGIIEKICSVTLDVPSSDNMGWIFRKELGLCNGLLCDGEVIPIKCCAHILDRIAEEGLKVAGDVLEKIREVVKGACGTKSRLIVFSRCVEKVGGIDNSDGLHLDVSGTWKAAYMMLKSAIKYSSAFDRLHEKLFDCSNSTFEEEWGKEIEWKRALRRAGNICDLLKHFYQLTNMVSGSTYPTSNTYFKEIWAIEIRLKEFKLSNDNLIRNMASKMSHEFDKYLGEHSMILAIGCVLDPRLKFRFVEDIYSEFDTNNDELVEEKLAGVRKTLYALFNKYANKCASTSSDSSTIDSGLSSPTHNKRKRESNLPSLFLGYEEKVRQKAYAAGKTELDLYLEEPYLGGRDLNFDVLDYWKNDGHHFGILRAMARDVLSIPLFTVGSDSVFSIGRDIFNKQRSCTLTKNLQARICSRNWLFGFSRDRLGDLTEETKKFDVNFSEQDLNDIAFDESENDEKNESDGLKEHKLFCNR